MTLADLQDRAFARATLTTIDTFLPERRLTPEQLAAYLDRRAYAVIGTTRPDERSHASMSMYVRRGTTFWLPTVSGSVRERNLRCQPWLTLVVPEGEFDDHIVVIVEGPAETLGINETYSAFVQGFMPTLARPEVDLLEGLTTTIVVDQERMGANARSTVGTATDANAMLRILFSRLGQPHIGPPTAYSFNVPTRRASGAMTARCEVRT